MLTYFQLRIILLFNKLFHRVSETNFSCDLSFLNIVIVLSLNGSSLSLFPPNILCFMTNHVSDACNSVLDPGMCIPDCSMLSIT